MAVSDLQTVPFPVIREQAERFLAELVGDDAGYIKTPLAEQDYDVDGLVERLKTALEHANAVRADQKTWIAGFYSETEGMSARAMDATLYLRSLRRRLEALSPTSDARVDRMLRQLKDYDLPIAGAPFNTVNEALKNVIPRLQEFGTETVAGLPKGFRDEASALLAHLSSKVHHEESAETRMEGATNALQAARKELVDACQSYLSMLGVVNAERADIGLPALPGGNLEQVNHWAATRAGEVAARAAAKETPVEPADMGASPS